MPRGTVSPRTQQTFDKFLELRDYADTAISSTTAQTAIALEATKDLEYKCVFNVATYTGYVATTAQWTVALEVSDLVGGTYVEIASYISTGLEQIFEVPLSGALVRSKLPTAAFIRVRAIKTGSPGNLTYGSYLTKV